MQKNTKQDLRERIIKLLSSQKEEERLSKSEEIKLKLLGLKEFENSTNILFYASFDGEVDTFEMIRHSLKIGKRIALPRIDKENMKIIPTKVENMDTDLEQGPYGIKQPKDEVDNAVSINDIDMVVVPGVAFDKHNHRLGRGGGFYDRFIEELPNETPTVGLAFDFQVVDELPLLEEHDKSVSLVLSN